MKLTKNKLKQIIQEELVTERLKRFKVYVSGEKEPLVLMGKSAKEVKQTAHMMIKNSSIKIRKVVREGKLTEDFGMSARQLPTFSSKEAKKVIDDSVRQYAKVLRKAQYQIVKDWMTKAKAGVLDYFDIVRGLQTGDASRAYPFEIKFLKGILDRDKIMNRFRSYFGGKKGKPGYRGPK
tara:strand:- start:640 stop:1176 length:537 start_codon:yes stop_codon:yes gene_type:complete